ncbi:hypothetical protein PM082_016795 [Marasmius tenuissimus]|nr:hypothetical protein PM082_016795 [Marasmius tenuissimus]
MCVYLRFIKGIHELILMIPLAHRDTQYTWQPKGYVDVYVTIHGYMIDYLNVNIFTLRYHPQHPLEDCYIVCSCSQPGMKWPYNCSGILLMKYGGRCPPKRPEW